MSLASDLSALALARATKAALSASLPPCPCGSGAGWVAGKGGALVCGECGGPVPVPTETARATLGSGAAAGLPGVEENAGASSTHPSPAGMVGGEGDAGSLVGSAVEGPGRAGMRASGGPAVSADAESANRTSPLCTDPDDQGGATPFSSVTGATGCEAFDVKQVNANGGDVIIPLDRQLVSGPAVAASSEVQVGVLRGKVGKQRRGSVEFYEDAKASHRRGMRKIRAFMKECEDQEVADRGLTRAELLVRPVEEGGKYRYEAMRDPHYKWALQEAGKFAHSQAPKEIKAETRLLIEFDMQ